MESSKPNVKDLTDLVDPLQIRGISVLHGANYFSAGSVIVLRLDLGDNHDRYTNMIEGFTEKLEQAFPGLYEHRSENIPGGFFKSVRSGTLLGHVAEHIAIELQTLAGMDVRFGKIRATKQKGVYNVVFRFMFEQAGILAAKATVNILNSLLRSEPVNVNDVVRELELLKESRVLAPGIQAIIDAAQIREIPVIDLDSYQLIQLGTGKYQKRIRSTLSPDTSCFAVENARDSFLSTLMMRNAGIPVPTTYRTDQVSGAILFQTNLGKPIVLKHPINSVNRSIFPALYDLTSITKAFELCQKHGRQVLVQEQIPGETFRLLVINNKFVAATRLEKPQIIGNGKDTIAQLIENLNHDQDRKPGNKGILSTIVPDEKTKETLLFYGYELTSIPDKGVKIMLNHHSSPMQGALTHDVTSDVHPFNRFMAERAAEVAGLDVAGINMVCPDIGKPISNGNGAIINVLAVPDFRMHINPWKGKSRKVEDAFLEMIFPEDAPSRIPVFSITGSAGKSVCASLINFMLEKEGFKTGMAHTDGIFSGGRKIVKGDMATSHAAKLLLKDPGIDCAVLETSVESIISHGLGYEFADFGIVLNAHEQTLLKYDLDGAEDIAYAQSIVAEEVYRTGFSILNANDPLVLGMKERISANLALFAPNVENPEFKKHVLNGGWGCGLDHETIFLWSKSGKISIAALDDIPLWASGRNQIYLDSMMAAILTMAVFDVHPEKIKHHIKAFKPVVHIMNGRLTDAFLNKNAILIDKPSGPHALLHIKDIIQKKGMDPIFYIDISGNIPDDFFQNFTISFAHLTPEVFLFSSAIHSSQRIGSNVQLSYSDTIISLNEHYLTESSELIAGNHYYNIENPDYLSSLMQTEKFKAEHLPDIEAFLKKIQAPADQKLQIIFSWNFNELNPLIQPLLEYP